LNSRQENVFLIGPRASGKSTLGKALAKRLERPFVDTDTMIVRRCQASISELVERYGWGGFRDREHEVLASICQQSGQIVACGGGIVLRKTNRELLSDHGLVLYLLADARLLLQRLTQDPRPENRPRFETGPLKKELQAMLKARSPLYREAMDLCLRAENPIQSLVQEAIAAIGSQPDPAKRRSHPRS
jgi:shikimate kinase